MSATIWNGCGNSTTLYKTINVDSTNSYVNPAIWSFNNTACPGDNVSIGPTHEVEGSSYTYYWDLGEGTLDTTIGIGVNHVYDSIGAYIVNAIVISPPLTKI